MPTYLMQVQLPAAVVRMPEIPGNSRFCVYTTMDALAFSKRSALDPIFLSFSYRSIFRRAIVDGQQKRNYSFAFSPKTFVVYTGPESSEAQFCRYEIENPLNGGDLHLFHWGVTRLCDVIICRIELMKGVVFFLRYLLWLSFFVDVLTSSSQWQEQDNDPRQQPV